MCTLLACRQDHDGGEDTATNNVAHSDVTEARGRQVCSSHGVGAWRLDVVHPLAIWLNAGPSQHLRALPRHNRQRGARIGGATSVGRQWSSAALACFGEQEGHWRGGASCYTPCEGRANCDLDDVRVTPPILAHPHRHCTRRTTRPSWWNRKGKASDALVHVRQLSGVFAMGISFTMLPWSRKALRGLCRSRNRSRGSGGGGGGCGRGGGRRNHSMCCCC